MKKFIAEQLTIPNPEYITRVKMNLYLGRTPKNLKYYEEDGDTIIVPYGFLQSIYIYMLNCVDLTTVEMRTILNRDKKADWSGNTIIPRDYQRVAVNAMLYHKFGILKSPCSSGKTIMGHLIAMGTGMRTLWLTHTKELLNQSKAVGEMVLGKGDRVGTITDGKVNIGSVITYATVQTMFKVDPSVYRNEFNCVIVDECHRITTKKATSQFSYVVNNIAAEYKYGLSATPETHDGYGKTVMFNLGSIKHSIDKEDLEEVGTVMPVKICPVFTKWEYPEDALRPDGTVDFQRATKCLMCDENRNGRIVGLIGNAPTLILSNSIDHLCHIANCLAPDQQKKACLIATKHDPDILTADIECKHTDKARAEYIEMVRTGKKDIMFSTYQLAKEGLNIPRLEQVIMAFPAVEENIITQVIGRVARTCDGKNNAICYDMVDSTGYFIKKWKARVKLYKRQGNEIIQEGY